MSGALLAAALAAACVSRAAAEAPMKVFPAAGITALRVESDGGDIEVRDGVAPDVRAQVLNDDPKTCLVTAEARDATVFLKAEGRRRLFGKSRCLAGFRVEGPGSLVLRAASGMGDITVERIRGALRIDAGMGDISVRDASADVTAHVGMGRADLRWSQAPASGAVRVEVGKGDVLLELPPDARLSARLTSGIGRTINEFGDVEDAALRIVATAGMGTVAVRRRP